MLTQAQDPDQLAIDGFWIAVWFGVVIAILWWASGFDSNGIRRWRMCLSIAQLWYDGFYTRFVDRGYDIDDESDGVPVVGDCNMSSADGDDTPTNGVSTPDNAPVDGQLPAANRLVDINLVSLDDAREVIRFFAQVDAVHSLISSGVVTNQAKAIEAVFNCTRSSRPGSVYMKVKAALSAIGAHPTPCVGEGKEDAETEEDEVQLVT